MYNNNYREPSSVEEYKLYFKTHYWRAPLCPDEEKKSKMLFIGQKQIPPFKFFKDVFKITLFFTF